VFFGVAHVQATTPARRLDRVPRQRTEHGRLFGAQVSLTSKQAWASPALSGEIYGERWSTPVRLCATESDTVYALNSSHGSVVWSRHLASAVPTADLPCGNISPTVGITGTPVIDPSRHEIFMVATRFLAVRPSTGSMPEHEYGHIELRERVRPARLVPQALLQRTGLNLVDGRWSSDGGNYGDCATYRGRVISVKVTGSKPAIFTVDNQAGNSQGAVWMGGAAPVVDAKGNVWVSVGNGSVRSTGQAYDDSDRCWNSQRPVDWSSISLRRVGPLTTRTIST